MRHIWKKRHRSRPKKSIVRSRWFWTLVIFFIILGDLGYKALFIPTFQIKEIIISGNQKVSQGKLHELMVNSIERRFLFLSSQSIFTLPSSAIKLKILQNFPQISSAQLTRKLPDTLVVRVKEREPIVVWCPQERCFFIDKDGVAFEEYKNTENRFVIRDSSAQNPDLGRQVIAIEKLSDVLTLKQAIKDSSQIDVAEIIFSSEGRVNVKSAEGWDIYFNFPVDNLSWQMTRLKLVLEKEIPAQRRQDLEYIDLRFSKVYYK